MVQNAAVGVERVFIGGGCNRIVNNVSWGACGLVSFGSQNAVSIFSPQVFLLLYDPSPVLIIVFLLLLNPK